MTNRDPSPGRRESLDAKVECEVWSSGDLGAVVMDRAQPSQRALNERDRRQQQTSRADIKRLQHIQNETHIVIERYPTGISGPCGVVQGHPYHLEVFNEIAVS